MKFLPESSLPSPFAHNLLVLSDLDIVLIDDRKKALLELHKKIIEDVGI
jgi:Lhr-like helicase